MKQAGRPGIAPAGLPRQLGRAALWPLRVAGYALVYVCLFAAAVVALALLARHQRTPLA